ncbi:hypothetical protein P6439_14235 [Staphylococcus arlettae]|nr:hypothetical protein [Staphylococcus arlettae]
MNTKQLLDYLNYIGLNVQEVELVYIKVIRATLSSGIALGYGLIRVVM